MQMMMMMMMMTTTTALAATAVLVIVCMSQNIIQVINLRWMRRARHLALVVEQRNEYRVVVGKCEGKRPLARPRCKLNYNVKLNLLKSNAALW
jgi:hypothetical protein